MERKEETSDAWLLPPLHQLPPLALTPPPYPKKYVLQHNHPCRHTSRLDGLVRAIDAQHNNFAGAVKQKKKKIASLTIDGHVYAEQEWDSFRAHPTPPFHQPDPICPYQTLVRW